MVRLPPTVPERFSPGKLTFQQTLFVSALLRDHPRGTVYERNGTPVFVSETKTEWLEVDLVSFSAHYSKQDRGSKVGGIRREGAHSRSR
jgi:hypothetical protein